MFDKIKGNKELVELLQENKYVEFYEKLLKIVLKEIDCTEESKIDRCTNLRGGSAYVIINERYKANRVLKNIQKCTIKHFYTKTLFDIIDNYKFNYKYFNKVYKIIYIECEKTEDSELKNILEEWLFYTFGMINNHVVYSDSDVSYEIVTKSTNLLTDIHSDFKSEIISIDTDRIWFRYSPYLIDKLNSLNYNIKIENIDNFILLSKKRYLEWDNDQNVKHRGLPIS